MTRRHYKTELIERHYRDGIHATGIGIAIYPAKEKDGGGYMVRTRAPGGSVHGTRYYHYDTYADALERAFTWHTKTLPNRDAAERREENRKAALRARNEANANL